jgi:NAD(P)-dependent dehydrogenase (short-subunit alcohol dehydrogenase family)
MKKTAIVTGGSRGIGYAIARQLGRDGYAVVIMASGPEEKYKAALDALSVEKIEWAYSRGDIVSPKDRERCVETAIARFGRIDALVNNAGVAPRVRTDLLDMTEESFDHVVGVNTKGTLFMSQIVAKRMIAQEMVGNRRGIIVNISSCSAVVSSTNRGEYCVSKAGVSMLTTLFADRLSSEGIFVYEVRPGVIATDMTLGVQDKYDGLIENGVFPIKRWGNPEDVANAVSVFCMDKLLYTTGNYIDVDGGFHIQRL